jgi:GntR family transcriptional regulator
MRHTITVCRMRIDPDAGEHPYLQLAAILRERIQAGKIGPRVPSLKELAGQTGLAVVTVQKALRVLKDEGLIYTTPGRGTFVRQ